MGNPLPAMDSTAVHAFFPVPHMQVPPYIPHMPYINNPLAAMHPAAAHANAIAVAAGAPLAANSGTLATAPLVPAPPAALVTFQGAAPTIRNRTDLPQHVINAHQQLPLQFAAAPNAAYVQMFGSVPTDDTSFVYGRYDWKETPEAHIIKADLPGMKKEEVKVEVEEGRILQISGERSNEQEEENDQWHCFERSSGEFYPRFHLPKNAKVEEVEASMENGVLTVTVPKKEMKSIKISG